jgi:hypothetical protein
VGVQNSSYGFMTNSTEISKEDLGSKAKVGHSVGAPAGAPDRMMPGGIVGVELR